MKKLRNLICSVLALVFVFSMTACGGKKGGGDSDPNTVRIYLWNDTGSTSLTPNTLQDSGLK